MKRHTTYGTGAAVLRLPKYQRGRPTTPPPTWYRRQHDAADEHDGLTSTRGHSRTAVVERPHIDLWCSGKLRATAPTMHTGHLLDVRVLFG